MHVAVAFDVAAVVDVDVAVGAVVLLSCGLPLHDAVVADADDVDAVTVALAVAVAVVVTISAAVSISVSVSVAVVAVALIMRINHQQHCVFHVTSCFK